MFLLSNTVIVISLFSHSHSSLFFDVLGLVTLIHNYVDAINKGSIPTIHTAWER
jgi:hypothetical protein